MPRANIEKPFPEYKWRWAVLTPSESLNQPTALLGVLRVLRNNEGLPASDGAVQQGLSQVQADLNTGITLARGLNRNLLRNSQQYWKATGLLATTQPGIQLTQFGRMVADGDLSREDFAAAVVLEHQLPNIAIEKSSTVQKWNAAGLTIRPLRLLLEICLKLYNHDPTSAYVTKDEVQKVVVPLAGASAGSTECAENILEFREDSNAFNHYPDCAPGSNDHRMVNEFLMFLTHHGFLDRETDYVYRLRAEDIPKLEQLLGSGIESGIIEQTAQSASESGATGNRDSERKLVLVTSRPNQARFRRDVLAAANHSCVLTGERLPEVLEAAHVRPFHLDGSDLVENGICMRRDIHKLFDSGHIRLSGSGAVHTSTAVRSTVSYAQLPSQIVLPPYLDIAQLEWRYRYY